MYWLIISDKEYSGCCGFSFFSQQRYCWVSYNQENMFIIFCKIQGLVVLWNGNWQIMLKLQILETNNSVVLRFYKYCFCLIRVD